MQENKPTYGSVDAIKLSTQYVGVATRINHCIESYQNQLFMIGGSPVLDSISDYHPRTVYCYKPEIKAWIKKQFSSGEGKFGGDVHNDIINYQCSCAIGHKMYLFGGSNEKNEPNNELLLFNMALMEWMPIRNQCPPEPRESACMVPLKDKFLILYGGINIPTLEVYEKFHVYNTETEKWSIALGYYNAILRPRFLMSMCTFKDTIYVFGGEFRNSKNENYVLDDFYELTATIGESQLELTCSIVRLRDTIKPSPKSGHHLLALGKQFLLLIGGDNSELDSISSIWLFHVENKLWRKVYLENGIPKLHSFACCMLSNKLVLYGGINSHDSVKADLYNISVNPKVIELFKIEPIKVCNLCRFSKINHRLPEEFIEKVVMLIDFPFSAIGLLLQNFANIGSENFYVTYCTEPNESERSALLFEENITFHYTYEELYNSISSFKYFSNYSFNLMDRKVKASIQKQCILTEYGLFIKIAALRLGKEFIYAIRKNSEGYFFAMLQQQSKQLGCYYEFYSFAIDIVSEKIIKGSKEDEEAIRQRLEVEPSKILQTKTRSDKNKAFLYVFNLRVAKKIDEQIIFELMPTNLHGIDIIYSPYQTIFETHSPEIKESIDISLKSYMSVFFLRAQSPNMKIKVFEKEQTILPQMCLEYFDRMVKNKSVYEIDNAMVNIELKIMELYYNHNLSASTFSLHNGVLLYHRGRLIQRFGCPLGELFRKYKSKHFNYFNLFGLLQIPDAVQTNIFRTQFVYNVMMEKLRSKLKFIEQSLIHTMDSGILKNYKGKAKAIKHTGKEISQMQEQQ